MTIAPITASPKTDAIQQAKLVDGAHDFEAMLLQQMLKPLQFGEAAGADADTDGDGNSGSANDTIRSMGVDAISKAIAQGGGVGIARQIVQQVNRQHESSLIKSHGY